MHLFLFSQSFLAKGLPRVSQRLHSHACTDERRKLWIRRLRERALQGVCNFPGAGVSDTAPWFPFPTWKNLHQPRRVRQIPSGRDGTRFCNRYCFLCFRKMNVHEDTYFYYQVKENNMIFDLCNNNDNQ